MNRVRIKVGKIALVFKHGDLQRVLTQGVHWLGWNESIKVYDLNAPFVTDMDMNLLLRNEALAAQLHIVEVGDDQLVLRYEDNLFKAVLCAGKYAFWKGVIDHHFVTVDLNKPEITENIPLSVLQHREVVNFLRVLVVESYEKGLLFKDGKFVGELQSGVHHYWKTPVVVQVLKADLRQLQLEVNGQEILTKDKAALRINFSLNYKIIDAQKAVVDNKDYEKQLYVLSQLALREFIGSMTLDEMLANKDNLSQYVQERVKAEADSLGVSILNSGIKDVILPGDMKEIMNQVLIAEKKAQANAIMRREETASTRSLLNTAKLMEDNAMLLKLKEMEYTEKIAERINSISISGGDKVVDQMRQLFGI